MLPFRISLFFTLVSAIGAAGEPAYLEEIVTPHWIERQAHAGGTIDALFLVNDLARREPDELGQRFDIAVQKVRTLRGSNAYKNVFDLEALDKQLQANPDVFVVSAAKAWKDLGPKGLELTTGWVRKGGRLVVFTRNAPERELEEMSLQPAEFREWTNEAVAGVDLEPVFPGKFRDSFEVKQVSLGEGEITLARPFDRAYVRFNAFFPKLGSWDDSEVARETGYLLANRIIRKAAGKGAGLGTEITVKPRQDGITLEGELDPGSACHIQVRSSSGQLLTEASATRLPVSLRVPSAGIVSVLWELRNPDERRLAMGTATVTLGEPEPFEVTGLASPHPRDEPVVVRWTPIRDPDDRRVEVEVYDPDRNRVRFSSAPASAGGLSIPVWETRYVSHEIRVVLTGPDESPNSPEDGVSQRSHVREGRRILAEHFQWLHLEGDPESDRRQWTTLAWGDERGDAADRWRAHRLRELGLNAIAPIGRNIAANEWASKSGMRVIPTNVFVPENRYNKGRFDEEQSKGWLTEFAAGVAPLSPIGYSFADEPPKEVILPWLEKGADVLASADPGARFGYCGVWPGPYSPELMRRSGYLGLYSPGHLYNLNIWLGIERDVYRSFRSPEGIVTIWTHYAPWADHEPYSRTVPWVWLFDGMDGVGYFKSAGMMFGILDGDLTTTHETRWWSEEIRELNAGVAEQVKRMERDSGSVRILFGGDLKAVEPWARALNELSLPYRFLDADRLTGASLDGVRLLVAVGDFEMGEAMEEFIGNGGILIGGGGLATSQGDSGGRFERLFGFAPESMAADATSEFAGIRSSATLGDIRLEGLTTGECLPGGAGGESWDSLGGGASIPDRLKTIAESNAIRSGSGGRAVYLALKPDVDSVKRWLPSLVKEAGVPVPEIRLASGDRIYLTRFSDGVGELAGLVPDYIRIPPEEQIREIEPNPRDSEDSVQKRQEAYFRSGPQRWPAVRTRLAFGKGKHVYDVREGHYLGKPDEREISIRPGHPRLFALLPYGPPDLKIETGDEIAAGTDMIFRVRLEAEAEKLAAHVIRAELVDESGRPVPGAVANLDAGNGIASGRFTIPHGQKPGGYRLVARDILTGAQSDSRVAVEAPRQLASAPLPPWDFRVERQPAGWIAGEWEPIPQDAAEIDVAPATAKVRALQRKAIHYGKYNGREHLMSGFTIGNGLRTYEMKYLVCCDPSVFDKGPPQRVRGLNGSGLGMNKPRGHLWYYNSYLKVYLGDREGEMVLDYELAKIEDLSDESNARVRLEWETPSATARLEYVMIPGHEGLFQELTIEPAGDRPLTEVTVNLISYPAGFGKGGEPFLEVAQEHREWLLMGDAVRDRDFYQSGKGSAGLLILPGEWAEVKYNARPLLTAKRPESEAVNPWRLHWVTWMFPDRGNAAAKAYMQTNSESTGRQLLEVFFFRELIGMQGPEGERESPPSYS